MSLVCDLTREEILAKVREHFTNPGATLSAVYSDEGRVTACRYRSDKDPHGATRCPVGVLVPDEHYRPEMEDAVANMALDRIGLVFTDYYVTTTWLNDLQATHDGAAYVGGDVDLFLEGLDWFERFAVPPHYDRKDGQACILYALSVHDDRPLELT